MTTFPRRARRRRARAVLASSALLLAAASGHAGDDRKAPDCPDAKLFEGGALTYGYKLPIEIIPRLSVFGEAGIGWGSADGSMFQTLATTIDTFDLTAGGRARYEVFSRLAVSARLTLGSSREAVKIADTMGHSASDHGWGGTTTTAIGLDLLAIDHPALGLGFRFEMGYTVASGVSLTTTPDRTDDGTIKLPMTDAALGHLDLGGPSWGFSLLGRF